MIHILHIFLILIRYSFYIDFLSTIMVLFFTLPDKLRARDSSFCQIFHRNRGEQRVPDKINICLHDFLKFRYLVLKSWRAVVDPKTKSFNIFLGVTANSYNIKIRARHRL